MTDLAGRQLGEFTLLDRIGAGGMGVVYRAHQVRLDRPAVVKVLYRMAPDPVATREGFLREARLASRVDHPFAAHVYQFGCEPDGTLWIAMERVNGVSLADWLHKHRQMSLEQFVPFFERVARVVQAAHERNILHRDLKPANIMVCEDGDQIYPKLLDFGLAKLLDGATTPGLRQLPDCSSDSSSNSTFLGTPYYAAPEMWTVPASAGPASDLYALGVVAFEVLTGVRPFEGDNAQAVGVEHMSGKYTAPPAGLESVFKRALARYPEDRYADALELAEAFRIEADARLAGQIRTSARQWIASGRSTSLLWRGDMLERMEEWEKRTSRADAKLSKTSSEFIEASRDEHLAEMERQRARHRRERNISCGAIALLAAVAAGGLYVRAELSDQRAAAAEQLTAATALTAEVEQGRAALLHDDLPEAQRHLGAAVDMGDASAATRFMLDRALQPVRAQLASLPALSGRMWSASWSQDGSQLATGDDRGAQIWDAKTHQQLFELAIGEAVYDVRWSGSELLTACGDGAVRVWNSRTGSLIRELRLHGRAPRWRYAVAAGPVVAAVDTLGAVAAVWSPWGDPVTMDLDGSEWPTLAASPDGRWLAAGGGSSVVIVELATGHRATIPGPGIRSIAWGAAGLLTGSTLGEASIWSASGERLQRLREVGEPVDVVAWGPDGHAAVASRDGSVQVFSAAGAPLSRGNEIHGKITAMDFTSAGLAVAGARGEVAVLDPATGMLVAQLGGQAGPVKAVRLTGSQVLAASWDGTARIWDARSPYRQWASQPLADSCGVISSQAPDSAIVAVPCPGHPTRVWDTEHGKLLAELPPLDRSASPVLPAVSGDRVAVAHGATAELYSTSGRLIFAAEHTAPVTAVAILNGELLSGDSAGVLMVDGRQESTGAAIDAIAVSGGRILIADEKGLRGVVALPIRARMLRPSPDGSRVLVVPSYMGSTGTPVLASDAGILARLDGPQVYGARWVSGGILTGHADGAVRLWSVAGVLKRTFRGARRFVSDADLAGSMVIGGSGDGVLHFWDMETGRPLWDMTAHRQQLLGLHALLDGSIATRGTGAEVSRWRIPD